MHFCLEQPNRLCNRVRNDCADIYSRNKMGSGSSRAKKSKLKGVTSTAIKVQPTAESVAAAEKAEPWTGDARDIVRPVLDADEIDLRGVSVGFLKEFREKIISKTAWIEKQSDKQGFGKNCSSAAVCANLCAKETEELKVAYIDLFTKKSEESTGTPYIGDANVFISHAWKYDCAEVIGSIIEAAEKIQEDRDSTDPLYFWFDICTVCQHETGVVRSQDWWANTFKASIAKIGYTLLILMPWDNPTPMTRAWCLWEMLSTLSSGTTLRCQMPKVEREKFNTSMEEDPVAVTNAMKVFEKIDARNAEAWVEADRLMIFNSVEASPGGFHDLNRAIKDQMREWVVDTAKMQEVDLRKAKEEADGKYDEVASESYKAPDKPQRITSMDVDRANVTEQLTRLQFNLGHLLNSLRRHDQADEVLGRCMKTAQVEWDKPEKHLDLAGLYRVLGQAAAGRADYSTAQRHYTKAVKVHQKYGDIRGPDEPAMRQVAELMMNLGQTAKSQDQLDQALQFFNTAFGYLTTLLEMGDDEYEELHKLAKPTIADGSDEDDAPPARPKTAGPLSREEKVERRGKRISQLRLLQADVKVNLGAVYASLAGKYTADANKAGHEGDQEMAAEMASKAQETLSESKKAYLTAEECYKEEHGESNFKYARVAVYLGNLAKKEGVSHMRARNRSDGEASFDEAALYYQRALVIHEQVVGRDHLDTAGILFSMGNVLAMRQKIPDAREKFSRALQIYQGRGMGQHPQAKMVEAALKSLQNK